MGHCCLVPLFSPEKIRGNNNSVKIDFIHYMGLFAILGACVCTLITVIVIIINVRKEKNRHIPSHVCPTKLVLPTQQASKVLTFSDKHALKKVWLHSVNIWREGKEVGRGEGKRDGVWRGREKDDNEDVRRLVLT